jgi:tRNA (cytidine/uridine-2'-O-)-methyltransferase
MAFNIVLVEPEIPQNTGNIVRTCAATGSRLLLVRPLGFEVTDKHLKRAGLDYWYLTDITYYDSIYEVMEKYKGGRFFFASTKSQKNYSDIKYRDGDFLVFGKETKGLDEKLLYDNYESCIRIPMIEESRSLNLSNSVAVILYEALRQSNFEGLKEFGKLTKFEKTI